MDVTLEQAYTEACKALGEALVRERLLTQELARRDQDAPKQSVTSDGQ